MNYFVIHPSEGDTTVEMLTKDEIEDRINSDYWGKHAIYIQDLPHERDTNYWKEDTVLIIKGEIVRPFGVLTAIRYKVPE